MLHCLPSSSFIDQSVPRSLSGQAALGVDYLSLCGSGEGDCGADMSE